MSDAAVDLEPDPFADLPNPAARAAATLQPTVTEDDRALRRAELLAQADVVEAEGRKAQAELLRFQADKAVRATVQAVEQPSGNGKRKLPETHTSDELMAMEFPEPVWLVPGIIPEGSTLLAGAPKVGKSWFALQLAGALSIGGHVLGSVQVSRQPVLYLALEDRPRRLQNRMRMLGLLPSKDFHYVCEWRRGNEGVEDLDAWLEFHRDVKVVILDVLEKIRGSRGNEGMYEADYRAVSALKALTDRRGVSDVILHHDRKAECSDWLDAISGSKGLTGAADSVLLLRRQVRREAKAELVLTGRDVEDAELALSFEEGLGWTLLGDAVEFRCTKERREILEALRTIGKPAGAKAVADIIGKSRPNVQQRLAAMLKEGVVTTDGAGHYQARVTAETPQSAVTPVTQLLSPSNGSNPSNESNESNESNGVIGEVVEDDLFF